MKKFLRSLYLSLFLVCGVAGAYAFDLTAYADTSVLASGKWVKISVEQSGMHCITPATLKSWGFNDPARVRVHGYGGEMLSDILSADTYIDDLPRVASTVTSRGLVFYAVGPVQINMSAAGLMTHAVNPYSNRGFYFLTEGSATTPAIEAGGTALDSADDCATSAPWLLVHEQDLISLGNSGRLMVGEEFTSVSRRDFKFTLANRVKETPLTLGCSFLAAALSASATVKHYVNGDELPYRTSDNINKISNEKGSWALQSKSSKAITPYSGPDNITVGVEFKGSGTVRSANLDYLTLAYTRAFSGSQEILCSQPRMASAGARGAGAHVWDVTDPRGYYELRVGAASGAWRNERAGVRRYAVWNEADEMPQPQKVADVKNQNLHASADLPDMIIVAPDAYLGVAAEIADIHHNYPLDTLRVATASLDNVLNEFGSGSFDPGAIRRYFKMLYDRGEAAGRPLRYALMIGKGTCDNRLLTPVGRSIAYPMPLWTSENSLNDSQSYSTDDYFGLLSDGDGTRPSVEKLNIAVGRIPANNVGEAAVAASKIRQYLYSMPAGNWRSRLLVLADDENQGQHMEQSERLIDNMQKGASGSRMIVDKVYCDAYIRANSTYPQAKTDLFSHFADGAGVFAFIGHGSPTALGSKVIIGPLDFRDRFHSRRLPFFYTATCSFLLWDTDQISKAEEMMFQADGGFIGCIAALRPVYISNNGNLSASFGTALGAFDADGRVPTIGEIYVNAKNGVNSDSNKLRYVLMCDPALRLSHPSATVVLDSINGQPVDADNPFTAMARQRLQIAGHVVGADGMPLTSFNGNVTATLFDAEFSTTSNGYGDGKPVIFEQKGGLLFSAAGSASGGRFTVSVQMPAIIADNFRPATLSLYAVADGNDGLVQAAGASTDIYAFGYDETTPDDSKPPTIHSMSLNGDSFKSGGKVNTSPLLLATVSDNSGISLSTAGVGQKMTLTVDGGQTFTDLSTYFTPDPVASEGAMSGSLCYPIANLKPGAHTLRLRVWDIDGNFADRELECNVVEGLAPEVYEVFTDALPARTQARFYVRHNRPDQLVRVQVGVYDLNGRPVWTGTSEARSNMGLTEPLVWDLTDSTGRRVKRGIYVYRATVSCDGSEATTKSKKMAVAAQ